MEKSCPSGLKQDTKQDEGDADIEGEIDLAPFAKDKKGQDDGVTGFQIIGQIDRESREAFQCLNLQEIHAHGAEQRMAEHKPEI